MPQDPSLSTQDSGLRTHLCAVWHGPGDVRLERRPVPTPSGDEVLVRVAACGLCGTDLHLVDGSLGLYQPPRILGHEVAGTVEAVGPQVRHLRPGDGVALDTTISCGACFYCREARPFLCPHRQAVFGGLAEYLALPERQAYRLPRSLPLEAGVLAEPLSCCLHALELAQVRPGGTVAVLGAGPMSLLLLQVVRLSGASVRLATSRDSARRALALRMGATHVVDPRAESLLERALEATDGLGVDSVFEAAGTLETVEQALALPRRGGTVVLVGLLPQDARLSLSPYDLVVRELTLRGAFVRALEFQRAVALLPQLDLEPFLSQRVPLAELHRALDLARQRSTPKVLVCPG
ncbi:MAG: alcohol dehydrogenase catalytic domain-containing protein [Chloroflexi bacterium]|nr:alcohol dehydrogenase catalytic domain-containing protein [Chloroflexota bacterium]